MDRNSELQFLLDKIRRTKGLDFSSYRQNTLRRRVGARLKATGSSDYLEYVSYLNHHPEEYDRFLEEITINVTEFFRNPETFAVIEKRVLPEIIRGKEEDEKKSLRIWCAGTSNGEEAYSMAILCLEVLQKKVKDFGVKVYGTDIDPSCIEKAKAGLYELDHLKEVSRPLLGKYFLKEEGGYRVKDEVKELTEFKPHNLVSEIPFANLDLILCRNVLIYFNKTLQEYALLSFSKALRPQGVLVLGKVESLSVYTQEFFETLNNRERIYRKIK